MKKLRLALVFLCSILLLSSCVSTGKEPDVVSAGYLETGAENDAALYQGLKRKVAIARFSNETQYAKGAFYDKENDPIGRQAMDILSTKLAASNKFILLERSDLELVEAEQKINMADSADSLQTVGADFIIVGSVTQYGRRNEGEVGLISRSITQVVEAGVSIRLIDVSSGQVIYSETGHGEAEVGNKTVLGLGGQAGYDSSLDDKAIDAAISALVNNIINNCMDKPWKSYILSHDENGTIISGGKSIGINVNDVFDVYQKGRKVKNPATGLMIELPGTKIGQVIVLMTGGDTPEGEYAFVDFITGDVDGNNLEEYYIQEVK